MNLNEMINQKLPGTATTQVVENGKYLRITMRAHWMAWQSYALLFGTNQSWLRINERGGFGEQELNAFYPEWRNHIVKNLRG